jgi:hypothetical protein
MNRGQLPKPCCRPLTGDGLDRPSGHNTICRNTPSHIMSPARDQPGSSAEVSLGVRGHTPPQRAHAPPTLRRLPTDDDRTALTTRAGTSKQGARDGVLDPGGTYAASAAWPEGRRHSAARRRARYWAEAIVRSGADIGRLGHALRRQSDRAGRGGARDRIRGLRSSADRRRRGLLPRRRSPSSGARSAVRRKSGAVSMRRWGPLTRRRDRPAFFPTTSSQSSRLPAPVGSTVPARHRSPAR